MTHFCTVSLRVFPSTAAAC